MVVTLGEGETLVKMRLLLSVSQPRPQNRPHLGPVLREFDVVGLGWGFPAQAILMAKVETHRLGGLVRGGSARHLPPPPRASQGEAPHLTFRNASLLQARRPT